MSDRVENNSSESTDEYWCFISYRHADNREQDRNWASWIHHEIERYEVPVDLVGKETERDGTIPERIYPVFRDEESLPADADLSQSITGALDRSKTLLVLCSPRAVKSVYVSQEIRHFKESGKSDRIIAAILAGEPGDPDRNCFPSDLLVAYGKDGEPASEMIAEPIAADFRLSSGEEGFISAAAYRLSLNHLPPHEATKLAARYAEQLQLMKLKIIAGILGVPLERLRDRDKAYQLMLSQKRFRRLLYVLAIVALLGVLAAASGVIAWRALRAEAIQRAAVAEKSDQLALKFAEADFRQALSTRDPIQRRQLLERSLSTKPMAKTRSHLDFDNLLKRNPVFTNSFPIESDVESEVIQAGRYLYVNSSDRVIEYDLSAAATSRSLDDIEVTSASPDGLYVIARTGGNDNPGILKSLAVPIRDHPGDGVGRTEFLSFHGAGHDLASISGSKISFIDPATGEPTGLPLDLSGITKSQGKPISPPSHIIWSDDLNMIAIRPDLTDGSTFLINRREKTGKLISHEPWRRLMKVSDDAERLVWRVEGDAGGKVEIYSVEKGGVLTELRAVVDPIFMGDDMFAGVSGEIRMYSISAGEMETSAPVSARITSMALLNERTLAVGMEDGFVELLDPTDLSMSARPVATNGAVKWLGTPDGGRTLHALKGDGMMGSWTLNDSPLGFPSAEFSEQVVSLRKTSGGLEALTADNNRYSLEFAKGSVSPSRIVRQPLEGDERAKPNSLDITTPDTTVQTNLSGVNVTHRGVRRYYPFERARIKATALDDSGKFLALGFEDGRLSVIDLDEAAVMESDWKSPADISSMTFFPATRSLVVGTFRKCYFLPADWLGPH